jgi:exodeoxyribonuclease VII large subunit
MLDKKLHALELMERSLELMSPEAALRKGFAIVSKNGKAVRVADLKTDDEIKITLIDGEVGAVIKV